MGNKSPDKFSFVCGQIIGKLLHQNELYPNDLQVQVIKKKNLSSWELKTVQLS